MPNTFDRLSQAGVAVWLDDLSRPLIQSGALGALVDERKVVGVTTNPSIFAKSIGEGAGYELQTKDLALRGLEIGESLRLLTAWDVRAACDILRPAYEASGRRDGRVSIEVDPRLARDAARTAAEACGLWWLVDRPNLFIKIPATEGGLAAITAALAEGVSVNVTLIFSLDRYRAVLNAFMSGLEQRASAGQSLDGLESVASFFISRVDVEIDRLLQETSAASGFGEPEVKALHGNGAIANARMAYEIYKEAEGTPRWQALAAKGGRLQRLLWASTGVKDKAFPPTRFVTELVAPDTVNTMPKATLEAIGAYEGPIGDSVTDNIGEAHTLADRLAAAGINILEVANRLERQGLESFEQSWDELTQSVKRQIDAARSSTELSA